MLEEDYSERLNKLLDACECDLAIPVEYQDNLARQGVIQPVVDDRRRYVRHRFTCRGVLQYGETFSSIPRKRTLTQIVTCDISRSGIAFLHSEQLFPGERILLWLPNAKQAYVVARCVELNGNCFEIGASIADDDLEASSK